MTMTADWDRDKLAELRSLGPEFLPIIFDEWVRNTASESKNLEDGVRARSPDPVRRASHAIKGASLMVGARRVADVAKQIEELARESMKLQDTHAPHAQAHWDKALLRVASLVIELRRTFIDAQGTFPSR